MIDKIWVMNMLVPQFFLEDHFSDFEDIIKKHSSGRKLIRKGTILHNAQAENKISYYIKEGIATLKMINESGHENILFFLCKGSVYPINTIPTALSMDGYLHLTAATDLKVLTFPAGNIQRMMAESHAFQDAVVRHYVKYTNVLLCKILLNSYNDSQKCICSFLYLYKAYYGNNPKLNLNQEQIGQLLGLSRIQVARVLNVLRRESIIETSRNSIIIQDVDRLLNYCSDIVID